MLYVLVFRTALTNYHKLGGLKQQEFILLWFWRTEVQNQVQKPWQGVWGSDGDTVLCLLPSFWWLLAVLSILWLVDASIQTVFTWCSSSVSLGPNFPLTRTSVTGWGPPSILSSSYPDYICKDPTSQKMSYSQVTEFRTWNLSFQWTQLNPLDKNFPWDYDKIQATPENSSKYMENTCTKQIEDSEHFTTYFCSPGVLTQSKSILFHLKVRLNLNVFHMIFFYYKLY